MVSRIRIGEFREVMPFLKIIRQKCKAKKDLTEQEHSICLDTGTTIAERNIDFEHLKDVEFMAVIFSLNFVIKERVSDEVSKLARMRKDELQIALIVTRVQISIKRGKGRFSGTVEIRLYSIWITHVPLWLLKQCGVKVF